MPKLWKMGAQWYQTGDKIKTNVDKREITKTLEKGCRKEHAKESLNCSSWPSWWMEGGRAGIILYQIKLITIKLYQIKVSS